MPSRRSDRGGSLRRQLKRNAAKQPELKAAIEERKRFENDRDYWLGVGFEEWDSLDNDTRQDLIREAVVVGGIGGLADVATSPRKAGIKQGTREVLKRAAPDLAKRLYAAKPRKAVESLIQRIKDVRDSRPNQERWNTIRAALGKKPKETTYKETVFTGPPRPPSNKNVWGDKLDPVVRRMPKTIEEAVRQSAQRATKEMEDWVKQKARTPITTKYKWWEKDLPLYLNDKSLLSPVALNTRENMQHIGIDRFTPEGVIASPVLGALGLQPSDRDLNIRLMKERNQQRRDDAYGRKSTKKKPKQVPAFDLEGRPNKAAKELGMKSMYELTDAEWERAFRNPDDYKRGK